MIAKLKPAPKNVPKWFVEWCRGTNNDCLSAWHGYQKGKRDARLLDCVGNRIVKELQRSPTEREVKG